MHADVFFTRHSGTRIIISWIKSVIKISILLVAVSLIACSRISKSLPEDVRLRISKLSSFAYLVPKSENEVPREFVAEIDNQIQTELKNRGYVLLDKRVIKQYCLENQCENLPMEYRVDALAQFTLNKVRRINAIIGHFNEVGGTLTIFRPDGTKITSISEVLRERGGLLFNAGQLIKGVVSSVKNTAQEKYTLLSAKLARNISLQLPIPEKSSPTSLSIFSVSTFYEKGEISVKKIGAKPEASTVCLNGSPHQLAKLAINKREINMIEIVPGKYCRTLATEIFTDSKFSGQVELKSTFGTEIRRSIPPLS